MNSLSRPLGQSTPPQRAPTRPASRVVLRVILAVIYFGVGVVHLLQPDAFLPIMPAWVPEPRDVVLVTGVCELLGSTALLVPRLRRWAGIMLALYAICVFPANIKHAIDNVNIPSLPSSWWYHGPRLLFQPVFVWWALFVGDVIDWPFGPKREQRAQDA